MTAPPWMDAARAKLGIRETPGPASNPTIMGWVKRLGQKLAAPYPSDATPWCALYVTECLDEVGIATPRPGLRARAYALWGEATDPCEGAVLVFEREGGGHVGFYDGENSTSYRVLGGNQGDAVCYAWIAKSRCIAVRWPQSYRPKGARRWLNAGGQLSKNEA